MNNEDNRPETGFPRKRTKNKLLSFGYKRLLPLVALATVLMGAIFYFLVPHELVVEGKPISYWVSRLGIGDSHALSVMDQFRNTKKKPATLPPDLAAPYLIKAILYKRNTFEKLYVKYYKTIPAVIRTHLQAPPLNGQISATRSEAAYCFGNLHPTNSWPDSLILPLVDALESDDNEIRLCSGIALINYNHPIECAVPRICRMIKTRSEKLNGITLSILQHSQPAANSAIPYLTEYLQSTNSDSWRIACACSLWKLDKSQVALIRQTALVLSTNANPGTRIDSADLLWSIDKDPAVVVPIINRLLDEDDPTFDHRCMLTLKRIGPKAAAAAPSVAAWLSRNRVKKQRQAYLIKEAEDVLKKFPSAN